MAPTAHFNDVAIDIETTEVKCKRMVDLNEAVGVIDPALGAEAPPLSSYLGPESSSRPISGSQSAFSFSR